MTIHSLMGPGDTGEPEEPSSPQPGESPVSYALRAIGGFFTSSRLANDQFHEARHDQAEAKRAGGDAKESAQQATAARERADAERRKASQHQRIPRGVGTSEAIVLALLDALPAYWTAEAFGLDQNSTVVLTVLLCTALGGAMWLLDLFAAKGRLVPLRILQASLAAAFAAMFVLRFNYLQVAGGGDPWSSAVQALALTAISAALVAVGYVVLRHRKPKTLADAERAARRLEGFSAEAEEKAAAADAKAAMSRAALQDTIVTWAVSHQPPGLAHEEFLEATGQAIDVLLNR